MEKELKIINIKDLIEKIIPKLSEKQKKGENGSICTIGGSLEYTGAPYYSAITSLKIGCDLSHIFCHTEASIPIKSYSPELIVHPAFNNSKDEILLNKSIRWFKSMDSILIGPGLGRENDIEFIFSLFSNKINELKNIPLIYDADALFFYGKCYKNLTSNNNLILTPNYTEFIKLCKELGSIFSIESSMLLNKFIENIISINGDILCLDNINEEFEKILKNEIELCKLFNNCILVKKGRVDIITNGKKVYFVKNSGSLKRTGGIGDVLGGCINCYCGMFSKKCKIENINFNQNDLMECATLGCYVCKYISKIAYDEMKYALTAPDIINKIGKCINDLYLG